MNENEIDMSGLDPVDEETRLRVDRALREADDREVLLNQADRGVPVYFHLGRLPEDELSQIIMDVLWFEWCNRAHVLPRWIEKTLEAEQERRQREAADGEITEAEIPCLPILDWTGPQLADALRFVYAVRYSPNSAAGKLIAAVAIIVTTEAARRLAKR